MNKISECEEQVMIVIWNSKDTLSLKGVQADVNAKFKHEWKPQTVSTFLSRLVKKGYLSMERKGRYCYYNPEVSLEEYRAEKINSLVQLLFNGDKSLAEEYFSDKKENGDTI